MGTRFRRSKSVGKFGKVNLTKGGLGFSVGAKGARVGMGPKGAYTSAGIPGTGLYSINYAGKGKKQKKDRSQTTHQSDPMPLPRELALSSAPIVVLILSVISLFIFLPLGIMGFIGSVIWLYFNNKSDKKAAHNAFKQAKANLLEGNEATAIDELEKAISYDPAANSLIPYLINLSFSAEDFKRAKYYSQAYLKTSPIDADAVKFNLALAESSLGNYPQAISILQELPEQWKSELKYIIALGHTFLESNQPELALQVLEAGPTRKRKMDGDMITFKYTLGRAYLAVDQPKKAITHLQKVYATDMNYENVKELLEELQKNK